MEDPDPGNHIVSQLLILAALTGINAFFACAEMATVSVNRTRIRMLAEDGNKKAKLLEALLQEPTKFLSTIQIAITLAGFFASASAATGLSVPLAQLLRNAGIPYASSIAVGVITILLSFFTLVLGELVPKRVALQKAEKISLFCVKPIALISKIASPFIWLLSVSTSTVLRILGMQMEDIEEKVSREEIRSMVEAGQVNGVFNEYERDMLDSIFEFDDKLAKEIMTSRTDVYAIDINDHLSEYLGELLEIRHSRIPVYCDSIDNIIGILYMKDLFAEAYRHGFDHVDIRSILHKPFFVPESKNIDELFIDLQEAKKYMAVLIDEYGGFSGIVTIEDLVEEVMGSIEDEYDNEEPEIQKLEDRLWLIDGLTSIDEINHELGLDIDSENFDTISGLLIDMIGMIPEENDQSVLNIGHLEFKIVNVKEKRIEKVTLRIKAPEEEQAEE